MNKNQHFFTFSIKLPKNICIFTQIQQDLESVQSAIRTLVSGGVVKEYSIGGRSLKKYDLSDLMALESRLKYQLKREQKADLIANGLGNPAAMYVRFN